MKTTHTLIAAGLLAALSTPVLANPPVTHALDANAYIGGKAGIMDPDYAGFDSAMNVGVYGGYHFFGKGGKFGRDLGGATFSVEGELTLSLVDGDVTGLGDWSVMTLGAYGVWRQPLGQMVYLKAKAGVTRVDYDVLGSVVDGVDHEGTLGFGAGFRVGSGVIEAEFTMIGSHMNFLSVGYTF